MSDPLGEILSQQFAGIDACERQMIILGLAELSLRRPGWEYAARELAKKLCGEDLFDQFRKTSQAPHGAILVDYSTPVSDRLRYTAEMRSEALEKFCAFLAKASNARGSLLVVFHENDRAEVFSASAPTGFDLPAKLRSLAQGIEDGDGMPLGNRGGTA